MIPTVESVTVLLLLFFPFNKIKVQFLFRVVKASHVLLNELSLPLLHCGPVEHVSHAGRLLLEELAVLSALLSPGRVKRRGVLVHQVGVLSAAGPPKVLDL